MNSLSNRLNVIAQEIGNYKTMADIGTDHGFLPIFLIKDMNFQHAILTDISRDSLDKARHNCSEKLSLEELGKVDFRLGNGIKVIEDNEVDCLVIAGMGGKLIWDILEDNDNRGHSFKRLILQPRNHVELLRQFLLNNGYSIEKERLVGEGRFICEIIIAAPLGITSVETKELSILEYEYPDWLLDNETELVLEYLKRKLNKENKILSNVLLGNSEPICREKELVQKAKIARITELIGRAGGK